VISGGETTVRVTQPDGRGGRNGEYLLALALALGEESGVHALAADTDGLDGTGDNAGALLTPDSLRRASAAGQDAVGQLAAQRSYDFFAALGDLVITGPTRTNVNDLRIALVA
jgi:hydroxypyruvate reductase